MSVRYDCSDPAWRRRGLDQAVRALGDGELVVLPTDTGYALTVDAFRPDATAALSRAKGREVASPPLFVADLRMLDGVASRVGDAARDLVRAWWPGPISLVTHAQPTLDWNVGSAITVRVPLHPVALEVLSRSGPLLAVGVGVGEQVRTATRAQELLGESVLVYLDAGTAPEQPPSTVVDARVEPLRVLREGAVPAEELAAWVPADPSPEVSA
ncbi:MAG: L-threonylcarbamoyladenylate synthase [Kineosporiaceae bacterium]